MAIESLISHKPQSSICLSIKRQPLVSAYPFTRSFIVMETPSFVKAFYQCSYQQRNHSRAKHMLRRTDGWSASERHEAVLLVSGWMIPPVRAEFYCVVTPDPRISVACFDVSGNNM